MQDLGYAEGSDFRMEYRSAKGSVREASRLARELAQLKVDVIVTGTDETTRAAQQATSTIPIVAVLYNSPVSTGLIDSLNRPGHNTTGIAARHVEVVGKRLELLKEMLPSIDRVAVLWDAYSSPQLDELRRAAVSLKVQIQPIEADAKYDLSPAFRSAEKQGCDALIVLTSGQFYEKSARIGALAIEHRIPTSTSFRDMTESGALMSYSTDVREGFYRAAYFVDRILKGDAPRDLPVEQLDVKLLVNGRTAKILGITIPQSILLRADEVIQ